MNKPTETTSLWIAIGARLLLMNDDRPIRALAALARAEERVPTIVSLQLRFRDAAPARGFTGLRLPWFDSPNEAIAFLKQEFPYLHPELVEPEEIAGAFASIGEAYEQNEIDHQMALERMSEVLANAIHQDADEAWQLGS